MAWNCARDEKSKHAYHIFFPFTTYLEKMLLHFIKKMDVYQDKQGDSL
jgi:hypothetical protein